MSEPALLRALRQALERDPTNAVLWLHYAEMLRAHGAAEDAAAELAALRRAGELLHPQALPHDQALRFVVLLRESGHLAEAVIRTEQLLETHDAAAVRLELARVLLARGDRDGAATQIGAARALDATATDPALEAALAAPSAAASAVSPPPAAPDGVATPEAGTPALAEVTPREPQSDAEWAAQFDWGDLRVTFDDVVGLDAVKKQVRLRIIAPFQNADVYRAFRRKAGGGILLYGPPGCGKTFLARATAGELGARFVSISIHDVVDKYWGESEKLVHALFDEARRRAPTVLFFDEFDALGAHRGRGESQFWKTLVNQLLHEMDGVGARNEGVLVFAATNMPWHVDVAFRRPGRFDRVLFVPPPDRDARAEILRRHVRDLPGGDGVDVAALAAETALLTGADLRALCERAAEGALERSLESGQVHEVTMADFRREAKTATSSATEWLATARNYARYANEGGQYDELADYLKSIKRW